MSSLSDRLTAISNRIRTGETMADIGTDHGLLPVYLYKSGRCPKVIMTDISEPSLDKARAEAADIDAPEGALNFRVGDGLKVLESGEVDTVVIAGMGGRLIRDIMAEDLEHTCSFNRFILQPRKGQGPLRRWLIDNGFVISSEEIVVEGKYLPEIIVAINPKARNPRRPGIAEPYIRAISEDDEDSIRLQVPPWIVNAHGPVDDYIKRIRDEKKKVLSNVMLSKTKLTEEEEKLAHEIKYLKILQIQRRKMQYKK